MTLATAIDRGGAAESPMHARCAGSRPGDHAVHAFNTSVLFMLVVAVRHVRRGRRRLLTSRIGGRSAQACENSHYQVVN